MKLLRRPGGLDLDEITRLYDNEAMPLLRFFMRRTCDADAAFDLVAETFARAFEDRRTFRASAGADARAWLYGIARHQLADYFRRGSVERRALERLGVERRPLTDVDYERIDELGSTEDVRGRVASELDRLPAEQREAVRLRVVDERPYPEVAKALGISEPAARARVSRALRSLRATLTPDLPEAHEHA